MHGAGAAAEASKKGSEAAAPATGADAGAVAAPKAAVAAVVAAAAAANLLSGFFPHAQQCSPALPYMASAAHSWPLAKPAPVQSGSGAWDNRCE